MDNFESNFGKALVFARLAHKGQVRKYTGEPYVNHCRAVADLVLAHHGSLDAVRAALLHDTIEDTDVNYREIIWFFGKPVADLVLEVSDVSKPEDGNRAKRKALDREHLAKSSPEGASIKLADLIDNTRSIVANDKDFAKVYLREKREVLPMLKQGNAALWAIAEQTLMDAEEFLQMAKHRGKA